MELLEDWLICLHANEIIAIILILQDGKLRKRDDNMLRLEETCPHVCKVMTQTVC